MALPGHRVPRIGVHPQSGIWDRLRAPLLLFAREEDVPLPPQYSTPNFFVSAVLMLTKLRPFTSSRSPAGARQYLYDSWLHRWDLERDDHPTRLR